MKLHHFFAGKSSDKPLSNPILLLVIIIFLCWPIIRPLFQPYITGTFDGLVHLFKTQAFYTSLTEGYLLPRWVGPAAHGLGSPLFIINYLLPYYLVSAIHALGISLLVSAQLFFAASIIFSVLFMYLLLQEIFGKKTAFLASLTYGYAPYHLMQIYVYSGWGEILAFAIVPLFYWQVFRMMKHTTLSNSIRIVITYFLLIFSHNLSAIFSTILLLMLLPAIFFRSKRVWSTLTWVILSLVFGVLFSTWFWLPSVMESKYFSYMAMLQSDHKNLWYFFGNVQPIVKNALQLLQFNRAGQYTFTIGIPAIILTGIAGILVCFNFYSLLFKKHKIPRSTMTLLYLTVANLVTFLVTLYLTRQSSQPFWENPFMIIVAYPYRLFFLLTITSTFLIAYVIQFAIEKLPRKPMAFVGVLLFLSVYWQGIAHTNPLLDHYVFPPDYFEREQNTWHAPLTPRNQGYSEFLPATADIKYAIKLDTNPRRGSIVEIISGSGEVKITKRTTHELMFLTQSNQPLQIRINIFYYPGWTAIINNKIAQTTMDTEGRILLALPSGQNNVHLFFADTWDRTLGKLISLVSVVIYIALIGFLMLKRKRKLRRINDEPGKTLA